MLAEEIEEKVDNLKKTVEHLEKFKKVTVNREYKMIELKKKINDLSNKYVKNNYQI